jgi:hypothetical protein
MDNRLGNMVAVVDVLVSPEDLDSPGEGMLGWFFLLGGSGLDGSFENFLGRRADSSRSPVDEDIGYFPLVSVALKEK